MRHLFLALTTLATATVLPAQNLFQNSSFTQGMLSWTTRGSFTHLIAAVFDVTGHGTQSPCAEAGLRRTEHAELAQQVGLVAGVPHQLTLDVAIDGPKSNGGPMPELSVLVAGVEVDRFQIQGFRWDFTRLTWRTSASLRLPASAGGVQEVALRLDNTVTDPTGGHTSFYVDDVELRPALDPSVDIAGDLFPSHAVDVTAHGTANAPFAVMIAFGALPQPVAVPGIAGQFELDGTAFVLFGGNLGATGERSVVVQVPDDPSLIGGALWLQGLQQDPTTQGVSLGNARRFRVRA
jgi:hypothetical protein